MSDSHECTGCREQASFSIVVSETPSEPSSVSPIRYYLPNQNAREAGKFNEIWFCHDCMRFVEDNFRASILYLQSESGLLNTQ